MGPLTVIGCVQPSWPRPLSPPQCPSVCSASLFSSSESFLIVRRWNHIYNPVTKHLWLDYISVTRMKQNFQVFIHAHMICDWLMCISLFFAECMVDTVVFCRRLLFCCFHGRIKPSFLNGMMRGKKPDTKSNLSIFRKNKWFSNGTRRGEKTTNKEPLWRKYIVLYWIIEWLWSSVCVCVFIPRCSCAVGPLGGTVHPCNGTEIARAPVLCVCQ